MKLDIGKKTLSQSNTGTLKENRKGELNISPNKNAQGKQNVYSQRPEEVAKKIYPEIKYQYSSDKGLDTLFKKLDAALTNKLDGEKYSGIYTLIFSSLSDEKSVSTLSEEAVKLFFQGTQHAVRIVAHKDEKISNSIAHDPEILAKKAKTSQAMDTLNDILGKDAGDLI